MRRLGAALLIAAAVGCSADPGSDAAPFDFYVLSLSWSPSYCATEARPGDRQCREDARLGFVVHGLWPQNEIGWPEFCEPGSREWVPDELVEDVIDLIPSPGLVGHQWRKHGSCTGLSQGAYFDVTRRARERVTLPEMPGRGDDEIEPEALARAFRDANPAIPVDGMAVTCDATHMREVRICMTRELSFRSCPEVAARACPIDSVRLPPVATDSR